MSDAPFPTLEFSEMKDAYPHRVLVDGLGVLVIKHEDEVYAISELCPHAQASMYNGDVDGDQIICPIHGARFDIKSGTPLMGPTATPLSCYEVNIEGNTVTVGPRRKSDHDPYSSYHF